MLREKNVEAEKVVQQLVLLIIQIILNDPLWKIFGFDKLPKRGRFFDRFVENKKLAKETYILQESIALALSYVVYLFKKELSEELQVALFCGILQELTTNNISMASRFENRDYAISYYEKNILKYLSQPKDKWGEIFIKDYPSDESEVTLFIKGVIISSPATSPFLNLELGVLNIINQYEIIGNVNIKGGTESNIFNSAKIIFGY